MNIWLRLIQIFIASFWKKRIAPTDPIINKFRVLLTEADISLMNNARYFLFMEVARFDMIVRTGVLSLSRKRGWVPLVAAQTLRYKRPIKRFQKFKIRSQLVGWDDRWFFVEQVFESGGKLAAFGLVKVCFRGKEGVISPQTAFEALGRRELSPPLPESVRQWIQWEAAQESALPHHS